VQEAADAARGALRATQAELAGRLRITAAPSFGRSVLVPLLAAFRAEHPAVSFELLFTDRRVDLLRESVDVAFRITRKPPEDWVAQPVLSFRVSAFGRASCFAPAEHPDALTQAPWLIFGAARHDGTALQWRHADGRAAHGLAQGVAYSEDMDSLVGLAMAGMGVVLTMDYVVAGAVRSGQLVDLLPDWSLSLAEGYLVQALTLPLPTTSETARTLVRFVAERLRVEA
jgi:DNA-binding transcriptional LysR family regulator